MRSFPQIVLDHLAAGTGLRPRLLLWISAPPVAGGPAESLGLWNGLGTRLFTVEGSARTYVGAGSLVEVAPITAAVGTKVRMLQVRLASAAPAVVLAARGYDLRLAPVELHRQLFEPASATPLGPPQRLWKGWIDSSAITTPAVGDEGAITLTLASAAMGLTRPLTARWSDASMRLRGDDRLFRHADVSGSVPVWWGEKRFDPTPAAAAPNRSPFRHAGRSPDVGDRL